MWVLLECRGGTGRAGRKAQPAEGGMLAPESIAAYLDFELPPGFADR
jgi:hypothetical protein